LADLADLLERADTHRLMDAEIRRLIGSEAGFKPFERIAAWRFVSRSFEVGDELTNTFKLKRHIISDRYARLIEAMFEPVGD
jgi:long-chain acyl-CoA synthetase